MSEAALAKPQPTPVAVRRAGTFWREDAPVMLDGQIVKGGMWPEQQKWWVLPEFIRAFVGGYGCGKTMIGAKRLISLALINAPAPVAYIAPTFALARTTGIATLSELLEGKAHLLRGGLAWEYNKSTHEFTIRHNGRTGTIWTYSGDNPVRLKGPNLAAAWIDEPFIQDEAVFKQIVARVRHPMATRKEIDLTGTPEQLNWGYRLCAGLDRKYKSVATVHSSTRSNLALGPEYLEQLTGFFDDKAIEAYVEGRFINLADGLVFYGFDPTPGGRHIAEREMPRGAVLGAGMDFNTVPMSASVFWRLGEHMHFIDEILLPNADTPTMARTIQQRYPGLREIYPDASGDNRNTVDLSTTNFTILRRAGFEVHARSQNPWIFDRFNAVNGKLRPVDPTGKLLPPTLTISPKCVRLIEYLSQYAHETMQQQKNMSHLLDAFSYPVVYLFPLNRDGSGVVKVVGT